MKGTEGFIFLMDKPGLWVEVYRNGILCIGPMINRVLFYQGLLYAYAHWNLEEVWSTKPIILSAY